MDPRSLLIQSCQRLSRQIGSSLPWSYRLARTLFELRIGATDSESFGRVAYGLFLLYGVAGMPPAPFMPTNTRETGDPRLKGYGKEFGKTAVGYANRLLRTKKDLVEENLAYVSLRMLSSSFKGGVAGKSLSEAERYVLGMIKNQATDQVREEQKRRVHDEIVETLDYPGAWSNLSDLLPESELTEINRKLEQRDPELPLYFQLLLEGYNTNQIADQNLLPSGRSQQALRRYQGIIKDVLQKHFQWESV